MDTYPQETAARDAGTVQDLSERLVMRSHCNTYTLFSGQSIPDSQWFSAVPFIKVFHINAIPCQKCIQPSVASSNGSYGFPKNARTSRWRSVALASILSIILPIALIILSDSSRMILARSDSFRTGCSILSFFKDSSSNLP